MSKFFSLPHLTAGFVAVLIGYTSAAAIVYQAAVASGASPEVVSSWMWAVGVGMGVSGILMTLKTKMPIIIAWSTPGAALLVTSLPGIPLSEAIGAFLFSSFLLTLFGITGWFEKLVELIPASIANAMLGGILLQFAFNAFKGLETEFLLVILMITTYVGSKLFTTRYAIPLTFLIGIGYAFFAGSLNTSQISLDLTWPVFTAPSFNIATLIGIGFPLFIVTMASQNIPGIAVLRAHEYDTSASPLITWSGITGIILAPFGGFAFNLAAITAAICMGEDIDKDKMKRYPAAIWAGIFYLIMGLLGATVTTLFALFPSALIAAIAGLALLGTILNSLKVVVTETEGQEAAFITFCITASGLQLWSIGAPFWGLVAGLSILYVTRYVSKQKDMRP